MSRKFDSGDLVTVSPVDTADLKVGDVVLCKAKGREYLHFVKAIGGAQYQIGNNRGGINGWISRAQIFGNCIAIDR